jgi:hypothetical protein
MYAPPQQLMEVDGQKRKLDSSLLPLVQDLCASVNKVASRLAHVSEGEDSVPRADGDKINSTVAGVGKAPLWAGEKRDARDVLHWDSE